MQRLRFAVARTRAHLPLVAVLCAMAALITIALAGTVTYLSTSSASAVQSVLAESEGSEATSTVQTRVAEDGQAQDDTVRSVVAEQLPGAAITGTVHTPPLAVADADADVVLLADAGLAEVATLTDGDWPTGSGQGALHAEAAEALEVGVGDELTIGSAEQVVQITGLWQPDEPQDPHWGGELIVEHGTNPLLPATYGPLLVPAEDITALDLDPFTRWVIAPPTPLEPDQVNTWISGLTALPGALDDADVAVRGLTITGTLPATLAHMSSGLASVSAAATVPLVIVALVSLVATWQIARLLATVRERENRLLRSRGGSYRQLIGTGAVEGAVVMGLGALVGVAVVLLGFASRPGVQPLLVALLAVAVAVVTAAILTAVNARAIVRALEPTSESGRSGQLMASGALVLLALAAAFTLWRFARNASPLVPGTSAVDPLAVSGPGLALLACALLAVTVAGPVLRVLAGRAGRRPGYAAVAALRQASRRIQLMAVPVILIVLASGVATLAATYAGTWNSLRTMSAEVSNGADVRVQLGTAVAAGHPRDVAAYAALQGADAVAPVVQESALSGDSTGTLTAVDVGELAVSSAPEAVLDPEQTAALLRPEQDPLAGIDVPEGTETLAMTVTASADSGTSGYTGSRRAVDVRLTLWDGAEIVTRTDSMPTLKAEGNPGVGPGAPDIEPSPDQGEPETADLSFDLPGGSAPWRVVAVDVLLDAAVIDTDYQVSIDSLSAGSADLLAQVEDPWDPTTLPLRSDQASVSGGDGPMALTATTTPMEIGFRISAGVEVARFMPPGEVPELPVLVTPDWSEQVLGTGSEVTVAGTDLLVHAVGQIPVVPGNPDTRAVLMDLPSLQEALLRQTTSARAVSGVWLATEEQGTLAAEAATLAGPRAEVTTAEAGAKDPVARPAQAVYWIAALCALLLALPAVAAVALAQASARRGEVVVLRAVGVGSALQARTRRAELLGLELAAVVAGALAGYGVAALVMTDLVRATSPQTSRAVPLDLTAHWLGGVGLLLVITATVLAVAFWYGRRVRRQVLDTTWREEIR